MAKRKNAPSRNLMPLILIGLGSLLVVGVLLWQMSQNRPKTSTTVRPGGPTLATDQIARVTPADARTAQENQQAVIVDVRDSNSYAQGHIAGSINIPYAELEQRIGELKVSQWIIPYCTWPAEETSARAAQILLSKGFEKVTPIKGGFAAWQEAGYPVETK